MKTFKIVSILAIFGFAFVVSTGVLAQTTTKDSVPAETTAGKAADMTYGEVRKIDKEAGKLTLKHERIENLDMPGMTMIFRVKENNMLDNIRVGEKIRFKAVKDKGRLTVTDIQADK